MAVTLDQAREHIGAGVVYYPHAHGAADRIEDGVITSVGDRYVFVRYAGDSGSKATDPAALDFLAGAQ